MNEMKECPFCKSGDVQMRVLGPLNETIQVNCLTCGLFLMPQLTALRIAEEIKLNSKSSAVLSYYCRRMQGDGGKPITITAALLDEFLKRDLPKAAEQADNFILLLGDCTAPGEQIRIDPNKTYALTGSHFRQGLIYIVQYLTPEFLLSDGPRDPADVCLTLKGWERYQVLKRGRSDTNKAFMAMKFNDPVLDVVFHHFKLAVDDTGFNLTRLDEKPKAGLIDDRLRVEIRTSRFLIVDLTEDNAGAYWESGFAEGLGKPVFYSCEKTFFETRKTHFHADHSYTVCWDGQNLSEAAEKLKRAIRATLPDEANMID